MNSSRSDVRQRPATLRWTAYGVAGLLVALGGIGHRSLSAHYARYNASIAIPAGTLARLPMQLGNWRGHDVPLSRNVVQATDTDDCINRVYEQAASFRTVSIFVGYGVRLRDLQPHRPEVCYPGAGWTMLESEAASIPLQGDGQLPCRIHRFRRGGLSTQHITVLNYYIIDGQFWPDVGQLRKQAAIMQSGGHYLTQVQIACMDGSKPGPAREAVQAFAATSARPLLDLIQQAVARSYQAAPSASPRRPPEPGKPQGSSEGRI